MTDQVRICPKCLLENPTDSTTCAGCYAPISDVTPTPKPAAASVPPVAPPVIQQSVYQPPAAQRRPLMSKTFVWIVALLLIAGGALRAWLYYGDKAETETTSLPSTRVSPAPTPSAPSKPLSTQPPANMAKAAPPTQVVDSYFQGCYKGSAQQVIASLDKKSVESLGGESAIKSQMNAQGTVPTKDIPKAVRCSYDGDVALVGVSLGSANPTFNMVTVQEGGQWKIDLNESQKRSREGLAAPT